MLLVNKETVVKKKRNKKYRPKEVKTPMIVRTYLHGDTVTDKELAFLDEAINFSIDKLQLLTADNDAYSVMDVACRHLYLLAVHFDEPERRQVLAQYARVALYALWKDKEHDPEQQVLANDNNFLMAIINIFAVVAAELKVIYSSSTYRELLIAEELQDRAPEITLGDCWVLNPKSEVEFDPRVYCKHGMCYINGEVSTGHLERIHGVPAWCIDNGPKLRVTHPIFLALDPKEEDYAV